MIDLQEQVLGLVQAQRYYLLNLVPDLQSPVEMQKDLEKLLRNARILVKKG